jgi:hypothetical protein
METQRTMFHRHIFLNPSPPLPYFPHFYFREEDQDLLKLNPPNSFKVRNQQGVNPGGTSIDAFGYILAAMGVLYYLVVQIRKSRFVTHKDN